MKKNILIYMLLLVHLQLFGSDLGEMKNDFIQCYNNNPVWFIDNPLNGIYDVQVTVVQHPKQQGWGATTSAVYSDKCVLISTDNKGETAVKFYNPKTGELRIPFGNSNITAVLNGFLRQIGDSNSYNFCFLVSEKTYRVSISDPWRFTLNVWLPRDVIELIFGTYNGTDISIKLDFVKEYPTQSMISDILAQIQRKQVEESVPTEWSGSCIAIAKDLVVTNYHVVENAKTLTVNNPETDGNTEYKAQIVMTDKFNDLAILRITDSRFNGFKIKYGLKYDVAEIGSDVFVLGYPLIETMGKDIKLTTGVISAKSGFQGDVSQYQISAAVQPGNSGGPLFDKMGNLIGIVSSKHRDTENVGYAIKLNYVKNLIESSNNPITTVTNNVISALSLPEKVRAIISCVMIVKAAGTDTESTGRQVLGQNDSPKSEEFSSHSQSSLTIENQAAELYKSCMDKINEFDYFGAYEDVCKAVNLRPSSVYLYAKGFMAMVYFHQPDTALEALERCISYEYRPNECFQMIAQCYFMKDEWQKCIDLCNKNLEKNKSDIYALYHRGLALSKQGNIDEAIKDFERAIRLDGTVKGDYSEIYNSLAYQMINKGKMSKAVEYIQKAIKHNPQNGNAWDTRGEINYRNGKYDLAIEALNKSITIGKSLPLIEHAEWLVNSYRYRGLAKKEIGNLVGAYKDLEHAIDLGCEEAKNEIAKIDASSLDFNNDGAFNIVTESPFIQKPSNYININQVIKTDEYTAIYATYSNNIIDKDGWYAIYGNSYIRDRSTGRRYPLVATTNCAVMPLKTTIRKGKTAHFILYYPPIPRDTSLIDFIDSDDSNWKCYGIELKK